MTTSLHRVSQSTAPLPKKSAQSDGQNISHSREDWITKAKCRQGDPDALFVRGAQQRKAAALCRHCPALDQCRAIALDNREEFGVWGGMTERQRRALLRKNRHIDNWANYFADGGQITGI
ncbi:WhiB family transcriptional regulator [Corynebacterium sp. A21]|uniref:WhiB family transcriptional regulator n=1 Tax=Corynebacterium sp. A21 TaxID=3457318 RepID=UPI003FCF7BE0